MPTEAALVKRTAAYAGDIVWSLTTDTLCWRHKAKYIKQSHSDKGPTSPRSFHPFNRLARYQLYLYRAVEDWTNDPYTDRRTLWSLGLQLKRLSLIQCIPTHKSPWTTMLPDRLHSKSICSVQIRRYDTKLGCLAACKYYCFFMCVCVCFTSRSTIFQSYHECGCLCHETR